MASKPTVVTTDLRNWHSTFLRATELDFHDEDSLYGTHGLHPFAAKCPPQLTRWAIERFSRPDQIVVDPMVGSGTTLVECRLLGRRGFGLDIDPLARLLARVKSTPLPRSALRVGVARLLHLIEEERLRLDDQWRPQLPRLDYWFDPEVAADLAAVRTAIRLSTDDQQVMEFLWIAFSSLIIARTSVANARDLVHSRNHHLRHRQTPNVIARLRQRLRLMTRLMEDFSAATSKAPRKTAATVVGRDARDLPLPSGVADLVFTSPPYCCAVDYTRAHIFAVAWMSDVLNTETERYRLLGRRYIGSERSPLSSGVTRTSLPSIDPLLVCLEAIDTERARVVARYFADMTTVLSEATRVLRDGGYLVLVVCPSHIRKIDVPTHLGFLDIASHLATDDGHQLDVVDLLERQMDDRRRLLPYQRQNFGPRMRSEYVLVLQKKARRTFTLRPER